MTVCAMAGSRGMCLYSTTRCWPGAIPECGSVQKAALVNRTKTKHAAESEHQNTGCGNTHCRTQYVCAPFYFWRDYIFRGPSGNADVYAVSCLQVLALQGNQLSTDDFPYMREPVEGIRAARSRAVAISIWKSSPRDSRGRSPPQSQSIQTVMYPASIRTSAIRADR